MKMYRNLLLFFLFNFNNLVMFINDDLFEYFNKIIQETLEIEKN
jgi:hypothetical protein